MRVDAEGGIVAQFFAMLKDKSWSHAPSADGTDVFKLRRAHSPHHGRDAHGRDARGC